MYNVNGNEPGLAAVAVGFTTDVCVEVAIVATISGSGLTGKDLSTSLDLELPLYGCFGSFLLVSCPFGTGVFCGEVVFPSCLVLV